MKKILIYISVLIMILGCFVILFHKNKLDDIYYSVVYIESIDEETITSGSGFIYKLENNKNYIITSYHVIEGYKDIYVYNNDKEKFKANILNYDEYTDIAVLTIEDDLRLKVINIGNSDNVNVDDNIYVVGTPISIDNINTIDKGIVSNKSKQITIDTTHGSSNLEVIEVSAEVDYGNSGGPLLNSNYEVIGMMFVKENNDVSYALPINFVIDIANKLINNQLKRPNLGAIMCNTTNIELLNQYEINIDDVVGVVLLEVNELGVLDSYELQKGDIITKFNNKKISDVNALREELYNKQIGDSVDLEYYRNKKYYQINIRLQ